MIGAKIKLAVLAAALAGAVLFHVDAVRDARRDGKAAATVECQAKEAARLRREADLADERDAKLNAAQAERARLFRERFAKTQNFTRMVDAYEQDLASRADPGCTLSEADALLLGRIM